MVRARADTLKDIWTALAASAVGSGYRTVAAQMDRPFSTEPRWLRRVPQTHTHCLYEKAVLHTFRLNPEIFVRPKSWISLLGWNLNILSSAALAYRRRVGPELPHWTLIGLFTRGNLLRLPALT